MLHELKEKIDKLYPPIAILTLFGIIISVILNLYGNESYAQLTLYIVLILGGIPILCGQLINVINFNFSSDILAAISISTAILLSEYLAASLVILMLSGGEALERYASGRASQALNAFIKRLPNTVKKLTDSTLTEVNISEIKVDDLFSLDPHQISPFDGIVENGKGSVDESLLTGEAYQVSKVKGSQIISGSVNGEVALIVKVTAIGQDTRYEKILKVMKDAQSKKLKLRRIGDQLGAWYTPIAVLLACIFGYYQDSSITFLSVLVVATPCPLIIAIPVAIIGSISKAAEKGILIRDPSILESISKIEKVYLDKTGTMTYGEPEITEIIKLSSEVDQNKILTFVASLEQFSTHPLSKPLVKYAKENNLDLVLPDSCQEQAGLGLIGSFNNCSLVITSRKIAKERYQAVNLPEKTIGLEVIVIYNSTPALLIKLRDQVKTGGKEFITHLKDKHGVKEISILSGDTEEEVQSLAKDVGITEIKAKLSPEDKYKIIKDNTEKSNILFIGDGINDAPALSAATIGIAFGTGSEVSSEAASAVILDGKLNKVDELFHIGKRTRQIALESAIGGMALSIIGMFLAGFGILSPVTGALAQEVIDVFAVVNALRTCLGSSKNIAN